MSKIDKIQEQILKIESAEEIIMTWKYAVNWNTMLSFFEYKKMKLEEKINKITK